MVVLGARPIGTRSLGDGSGALIPTPAAELTIDDSVITVASNEVTLSEGAELTIDDSVITVVSGEPTLEYSLSGTPVGFIPI